MELEAFSKAKKSPIGYLVRTSDSHFELGRNKKRLVFDCKKCSFFKNVQVKKFSAIRRSLRKI